MAAQNRSIFYKERSWNDIHIYNSKVLTGGVKIIQPAVYHELRGEISTLYHSDYYDRLLPTSERENGVVFKHDRYSKSHEGVLRGMHYDDKTWKLVSCIHGKMYLVVLDIRGGSRTSNPQYGSWETYIISPQTQTQVLIPPGFANGHYVMEDNSVFYYKLAYSGEYNDVENQGTVYWNDKKFNIEWPCTNPILSKRDIPNGN
jgi:dTDP-4-dehydrorhamnose 3,5-epimerase